MKPIEYCRAKEITSQDFIAQMQTAFPKYCKAANSMANRSEEYGVCLSPAAVRYLTGKPRENRTRPCRFTFRLLTADSEAFTRARLKAGQTVQEAVEKAVLMYIKASEDTDVSDP